MVGEKLRSVILKKNHREEINNIGKPRGLYPTLSECGNGLKVASRVCKNVQLWQKKNLHIHRTVCGEKVQTTKTRKIKYICDIYCSVRVDTRD